MRARARGNPTCGRYGGKAATRRETGADAASRRADPQERAGTRPGRTAGSGGAVQVVGATTGDEQRAEQGPDAPATLAARQSPARRARRIVRHTAGKRVVGGELDHVDHLLRYGGRSGGSLTVAFI